MGKYFVCHYATEQGSLTVRDADALPGGKEKMQNYEEGGPHSCGTRRKLDGALAVVENKHICNLNIFLQRRSLCTT